MKETVKCIDNYNRGYEVVFREMAFQVEGTASREVWRHKIKGLG